MKASEPSRWMGLPVFKLEVDRRGREVQISGKVISYSPSSARFLLLYEDGSSDGVPVNEIGDHVPLKLQLPLKKRRKKRKAEICRERTKATPVKRSKIAQHDPPSTQQPEKVQSKKLAIVTRFVQDTLCSLTAALDISDEKQRVLLAALDNRKEQPLAALERYDEEGGLEALNEKLRSCVREIKDKRHKGKENKDSHAVERPCRDEKEKSVPRRPFASLRTSSRCDQHLRDLMSGTLSVSSTLLQLPYRAMPHRQGYRCLLSKAYTGKGATGTLQGGTKSE
ncbi:hypothetical protein PHMEG_00024265 [Phytophthora megakarya]|uniref:Uncharacterized protein n=1 Tax=Phytophthora megakarya TaxID=4795 RepID=A0A225VEX6_9STRA|nr:hypothetical protein PHMEG_00024265 [Phytophthora megakarya]